MHHVSFIHPSVHGPQGVPKRAVVKSAAISMDLQISAFKEIYPKQDCWIIGRFYVYFFKEPASFFSKAAIPLYIATMGVGASQSPHILTDTGYVWGFDHFIACLCFPPV